MLLQATVKNMIDNGLLGDMYYGESNYFTNFQQHTGFPRKRTAIAEADLFRKKMAPV